MQIPKDSYGYVRLIGKGVNGGKIDLTKASQFLSGIDSNLRYFIDKENPEYTNLDYSLEVRIEPGSVWVILLGLGIFTGGAFLTGAAGQLGKNMVGKKKPSEVLQSSARKMQSTIKIAKHLGGMKNKNVTNVRFEDGNQIIVIPNSRGEYLPVSKEELDLFVEAPANLYESVVSAVNSDTALSIGVKGANGEVSEEKITLNDKQFFMGELEGMEEEIVLPGLKHGDFVELDGELTKGNSRTNNFGFAYQGHIITCSLKEGRVKDHKQEMFGKVRITGIVNRHYESKVSDEEKKKPKIIFESITSLENDEGNPRLL